MSRNPGQVKELQANNMAEVDIMGVSRHVSLDLVPDAKVDDWVLVHAGFAIQVVDEEYANETLRDPQGDGHRRRRRRRRA